MSKEVPIEISKVQILDLHPGDTIVVTVDRSISGEVAARIKEIMESKFPGHKALVLEKGMAIEVVRETP